MASEVGNGQVSIFPVFKGFRKAVSSEMDASAKAGSQGFQKAFSRTAKSTGASAGKGFKQAFQSSSNGLAEKSLKDLQSSVAKSSRAVSASRLKEQDAAGKVRVAEQRLLETRKKYGAESATTVAAEERLASAQRTLKSAQDATKTSTDGLKAAQGNLAKTSAQATAAATRSGGGIRPAFAGISSSVQVVGRNIGSFVSKGFDVARSAANRGMKAISTVAKITGAAVAAVLGGAIAAGFSRMTSIENAQAKLKGLGNSAKNVQAIMTNALAAVKGTAFGLDEAATIAASAVAAGIKPGQELEKYLRLTADAATIAGISLSDMGAIINKVTTRGKVGMENLNQVSERGIPIMQYLAKEYGVSQVELSKMVAAGKVDAETFRKVLTENLGGAALESGNTTTGAFKNMRAAMSRLGVAILDGPFPLFKDLFNLIGSGFDSLTDKIAPFSATLGPKLSAGFDSAVERARDFAGQVRNSLSAISQGFRGEWNQALSVDEQGPLFRLGALLQSGMDKAKSAVDSVRGAVDSLFGDVGRHAGVDLRAIFDAVDFSGFAEVGAQLSPLLNIFKGLQPVLPVIVEGLATIAATLGGALSSAAPVVADLFATIGEAVGSNLAALLPSVVGLFESLAVVFAALVPAVEPLVQQLGGVFAEALTALTPVLGQLVDFIAKLLPSLIPLIDPLVQIASAALQLLTPFLSLVSTVLPPLIDLITTMPGGLMTLQLSLFALKFVLEAVANALTFVADFMTGAMESVKLFAGYINGEFTPQQFIQQMTSIGGPFGELAKWAAQAGANIAAFVAGAVAKIKQFAADVASNVASAVKFFTDMPGKIQAGFASAGTLLAKVGKQIIDGLVGGIKNAAQSAIDAVSSVVTGAIDGAKSLLGIKSPSRVFRQIGDYVGQGFVQGLKGSSKQVRAAGQKMAGYVRDAASQKLLTGGASDRLVKSVQKATNQLAKVADARTAVAARLKKAQSALTDAVKVRDDFAKSVRDSVVDLGSIAGRATAGSMVQTLQKQIGNLNQFRSTIEQLKRLGLDQRSLSQLIEDFTSTGSGASASALLAGGAASVRQVASLQGSLAKAAASLGASSASTLYQAGVDSAKGLVKGLRSQESALAKQAEKFASTLVKSIKTKLKIKSPSRVMEQLGVFTGQGFVNGVDAQASAASRSLEALTSLPSAASLSRVASSASSAAPMTILVENPWTGEYHEARMRTVADGSVARNSRVTKTRISKGLQK